MLSLFSGDSLFSAAGRTFTAAYWEQRKKARNVTDFLQKLRFVVRSGWSARKSALPGCRRLGAEGDRPNQILTKAVESISSGTCSRWSASQGRLVSPLKSTCPLQWKHFSGMAEKGVEGIGAANGSAELSVQRESLFHRRLLRSRVK
jgi:hypothetical protein